MRLLRYLILSGILTAGLSAQAINCERLLVESESVMKDSQATGEQLQTIMDWILVQLGNKKDNSVLMGELNQILSKMGLPTVKATSPDFIVSPTYIHGSFGDTYVGVEIRDGAHRFCFPCFSGWNAFEMGIIPYAPPKRNETGRYFALINAVQKTEGYRRHGQTNSSRWEEERLASFVITSPEHQGVIIVRDNALEYYPAPLPQLVTPAASEPKPQSLLGRLLGRKPVVQPNPEPYWEGPIRVRLQLPKHPEVVVLTCESSFKGKLDSCNILAAEFRRSSDADHWDVRGPIRPVDIPTSEMEISILEHLHASALSLKEPNSYLGNHPENSLASRCDRLFALIQIPATTFDNPQFEIKRRSWITLAKEMDCPAPARITSAKKK